MIATFETQTKPLNEYEKDTLLPIMVKCLSKHIGKDRAISNAIGSVLLGTACANKTKAWELE